MAKKHTTRNMPLVIKGKERPKRVISRHATGAHCPMTAGQVWASILFQCCRAPLPPKEPAWSRAQLLFPCHSSSPGPALESPASHSQMGHQRPTTLAFTASLCIYERVVPVGCLTVSVSPFFFQAHWRHPMTLCFSVTARAKWAGPHGSKEEVPSPLKPQPWSRAPATCLVLLLKFIRWHSRPALLTMQIANQAPKWKKRKERGVWRWGSVSWISSSCG